MTWRKKALPWKPLTVTLCHNPVCLISAVSFYVICLNCSLHLVSPVIERYSLKRRKSGLIFKCCLDCVTSVSSLWLLIRGKGGGGDGGRDGVCDTPHLSRDDDLRVFTCAPTAASACEDDRDASPSALCRGFPLAITEAEAWTSSSGPFFLSRSLLNSGWGVDLEKGGKKVTMKATLQSPIWRCKELELVYYSCHQM